MSRVGIGRRSAAAALLSVAMAVAAGVAFGQTAQPAIGSASAAAPEPATDYDVAPRLQPSKYPLFLRSYVRAGKNATALIEYTVSAEGKAEAVRVVTTDDPKFAGHLVAVLRHSEFKPGLKDGKPVRATVRVQFDLK